MMKSKVQTLNWHTALIMGSRFYYFCSGINSNVIWTKAKCNAFYVCSLNVKRKKARQGAAMWNTYILKLIADCFRRYLQNCSTLQTKSHTTTHSYIVSLNTGIYLFQSRFRRFCESSFGRLGFHRACVYHLLNTPL